MITPPDKSRSLNTSNLHISATRWDFSSVLIILTLLLSAAFIALRAYYREPVSDDLLYGYILDEHTLGENDYTVPISGWSDAIKSQSIQYFYSNGRTLIHVLAQMFAGKWGCTAYAVFLGIMAIAVQILFILYTVPASKRKNPLIWISTAIIYLYLFQNNSGTWYSIVGGLNYMLPMIFVLSFLLLLRHFNNAPQPNIIIIIILCLLGLICGWSHECFSVPLSGALFFFIIFHLRNTKPIIWIMALSLWIGTGILVFAPGNFARLADKTIISTILNGIHLLEGTYLFWIMIVPLICMAIWKKSILKKFVSHNVVPFLALSIALVFGLIANTLPQSFTGISFYSAIIIFRLSYYCPNTDKSYIYYNCFTGILLILISINQYRIVAYSKAMKIFHHEFIISYLKSPNDIMAVPDSPSRPADIRPFVSSWFESPVRDWTMHTIDCHYNKNTKPIYLLEKTDYQIFTMDSLYFKNHGDPYANQQWVQGDQYLWLYNNDVVEGDSIKIEYNPIKLSYFDKLYIQFRRKLPLHASKSKTIQVDSTALRPSPNLTGIKIGGRRIKDYEIHRATNK